MTKKIYLMLTLIYIATLTASSQNILCYENESSDIRLSLHGNHTFSLSIFDDEYVAPNTNKVKYNGKWHTKSQDYVLTFTDKTPPFEVLFDEEYTPKGAVRILNHKSFAFDKTKSYVLIWGRLCKQMD